MTHGPGGSRAGRRTSSVRGRRPASIRCVSRALRAPLGPSHSTTLNARESPAWALDQRGWSHGQPRPWCCRRYCSGAGSPTWEAFRAGRVSGSWTRGAPLMGRPSAARAGGTVRLDSTATRAAAAGTVRAASTTSTVTRPEGASRVRRARPPTRAPRSVRAWESGCGSEGS